ncbi:MAG: LysM peptidoglycan-binding domain-containing protein [Bacteroidia bacterium]
MHLLLIALPLWAQVEPYALLQSSMKKMQSLQTLRYTLKKYERIQGKLLTEELQVKLQRKPFRVYAYYVAAPKNKGVKVLYNGEKFYVKPNSFPYLTLSIDPYSDLALDNQHQIIFAMGYDQMLSLLQAAEKKYDAQIPNQLRYSGTTTWENRKVHILTLEPPKYQILTYTPQNETLFQIAEKNHISWYKIMELNRLSSPSTKPKKPIQIPSDYGQKIRLFIDVENLLPIMIEVYDEIGLFEKYEYRHLQVNPPFTEKDFSKNNPEYDM